MAQGLYLYRICDVLKGVEMATEFMATCDIKLQTSDSIDQGSADALNMKDGKDYLLVGQIRYAVPNLSQRLSLSQPNMEKGEDGTMEGQMKFVQRVVLECLEFIREVDIKVYKPPVGNSGEKLPDPWKKFDPKTAELLEHIENKDVLGYFSFGTGLANHFSGHVIRGVQPGKSFKMVSKGS